MRWLVIYVVPWPKGKAPTAAAARGPSGSWAEHPAFGNMSGKDYGALIYRHFNHHLTQFGV